MFNSSVQAVNVFNNGIDAINDQIEVIKERVKSANIPALEADLAKLKATKNRYTEEMAAACKEYLEESDAKKQTEERRNNIREALEKHQKTIFPAFKNSINIYLPKFNAGFRLDNIEPENTRAGTACSYDVIIYNQPIAVDGSRSQPGQHAFKNTLSSGDRNTLALAFFFAMIEQDQNLKDLIVVIDDPMTSLDEHRTLTTAQEIRNLSKRVKQVIVLSHSKSFLCKIWKHLAPEHKSSMQVVRDGDESTFTEWNVNEDSITEFDRNHQLLREYSSNGGGSRPSAQAIRPTLEGYLRVACPEHFPAGAVLGKGIMETWSKHLSTPQEILSKTDLTELLNLTEYGSKFHHDTNLAWETEAINDGELLGFVKRTLEFIKRK